MDAFCCLAEQQLLLLEEVVSFRVGIVAVALASISI